MTTCVFRAINKQTLIDKLELLGIPMLDDDNGLRAARLGFASFVPWLVTALGEWVVTLALEDDEVALLPEITSPDFLCDWRDDEYFETTDAKGIVTSSLLPWPLYQRAGTDIDGKPVVYSQGAGRFSA